MANIKPVDRVKLIVAVLWSDTLILQKALKNLETVWGKIDFQGKDREFDVTDYYVSEMGSPISRRLVSFEKLINPDTIAEIKLRSNAIENNLAQNSHRKVNLDAGYLDHNKIILASAKYAGQKIYLGSGIYADIMGRYKQNQYQPFEWSFPDFKDGRYNEELNIIRKIYLQQLRENKD